MGLSQELYISGLADAQEEDDLWWQMRALQDLGWEDELERFFRDNAERIEAEGTETFRALLAEAQGRENDALEHRKEAVRRGEQPYWFSGSDAEDDDDPEPDAETT